MKKLLKALIIEENGQAIVEYMLTLMVAVSFVAILAVSFRKTLVKLWTTLTKEIIAACPGCPSPDSKVK